MVFVVLYEIQSITEAILQQIRVVEMWLKCCFWLYRSQTSLAYQCEHHSIANSRCIHLQ